MSESFGGQVVAFVTVASTGAVGWGGLKEKTKGATAVSGCRFRPFTTMEADQQTDVATEVWKLTAPPEAGVLAAASTGEILYDGTGSPDDLDLDSPEAQAATWQIDGQVQPKYDLDGTVHHVTVMCKRQRG